MVKLKSSEIVKGFSIVLILLSNSINYWIVFGDELKDIYGFIITILDIIGPLLYIFVGSLSISFTLNKKMGSYPEKIYRNKILKQALFLILLGCLYNIILNPNLGFPINLWGWNILVFLGFSQIICYLAYKLVRWARLVIGLSVIFLTPGFRELLFISKDTNLIMEAIHFMIVSPFPNYSLLPFASFSFFSAVFGEVIYESIILNSDRANLHSTQSILKYGLVLLACGLLLPFIDIGLVVGADNFDPSKYPFLEAVPILKAHNILYIQGLPLFLLRGTPSNLFLSMGLALLIFTIFYYYSDILHKNGKLCRILNIYGRHSLTIFFGQFLFILVLYQKVTLLLFFPYLILYIAILGVLFFLWQKNGKSILSLDWIIDKIGGKTKDYIHQDHYPSRS
ncbi:MAG: hypothetical protein HWN80_01160 [Candidatus Lokiarchaeota archaeon]|nr:hypothetical protein [Candidatus Lokiarchaeota archaeon]